MANADELRVLLTAKDDLSSKLKDVRATVKSLEKDMAAANAEFRETGNGAALTRYQDLYKQWEKATASQKEYASQLRRTNSSVRNFGNESTRQARQVESKWDSSFKKVAAGVAAAFSVQAVVDFGRQSVLAFSDAEASQRRLEYAFSNFARVNDVTIDSLRELNDEIQAKTGYDNDAIASGQAVLAQFKLTGQQIKEVTPLLVDYAAQQNIEIPDAAKNLGKALLGNAKALKNIGITYKATGDAGRDYANITDKIANKVGGFADNEAQTAAGTLRRLETLYGELQETVGEVLVPTLEVAIPAMQTFNDTLSDAVAPLVDVTAALGKLGDTQGETAQESSQFADDLRSDLTTAFMSLSGAVGLFATQLTLLHNSVVPDAAKALANSGVDFSGFTDAVDDGTAAVTDLAGALDLLDGRLAKRAALRSFRQALKDFIDEPSAESGDAVAAAMLRAADSFKNPEKQARYVKERFRDIAAAAADPSIPANIRNGLLKLLGDSRKEAELLLLTLKGLDGFTATAKVIIQKAGLSLFASGGLVTGPGTGTSDSIPAALSNGEYVVRAAAVRAVGVEALERINRADMTPVPALPVRGGDGASVTAPGGATVNIGAIHAESGVDVESALLQALMRADRVSRERR